MSSLSQFSRKAIKSIQRGTITASATNLPQGTATISSVDLTKSEINLLGISNVAAGAIAYVRSRVELTDATTVTAYGIGYNGGSSFSMTTHYQVVEYQ